MTPAPPPWGAGVGVTLPSGSRSAESKRARASPRLATRTAPVYVLPGNHDVRWWTRPLIPFAKGALYGKYVRYFGDDLAPTLRLPGAIIAGALTAHGVAWGSLTWRLRDLAVKGLLPKREYLRVQQLFREGAPGLARGRG